MKDAIKISKPFKMDVAMNAILKMVTVVMLNSKNVE